MAACVHYEARPLTPSRTFDGLAARTLSDPGLAQAVKPSVQLPVWPPAAWDLPALTAAAFYFHPDLEVARASWAEARTGLVAAGERPNPAVSAGPGFNSSTPAHTVTPWILNLDFDFTI